MDIKMWLLALLIFAPKLSDAQGKQHLLWYYPIEREHTCICANTYTHTEGLGEFWGLHD